MIDAFRVVYKTLSASLFSQRMLLISLAAKLRSLAAREKRRKRVWTMLRHCFVVTICLALFLALAISDVHAVCRPGLGCGPPRFDRPLTPQQKLEREQGEFGASCLAGGFLGLVVLMGLGQIALQVVAWRQEAARSPAGPRHRD